MLSRSGLAAVLLVVLILGTLCFAAPALGEERRPVPTETAQAQAMAIVREVYGREWDNAETSEDKQALALKLLETAADSPDEANRYVLLKVAADVGAQAGDAALALQAAEAMAGRYELDAYKLKGATLSQAARGARSQKQNQTAAELLLKLIDEAVEKDDFAAARYLGDLAAASARKARAYALVRQIVDRNEEVEEIAKTYDDTRDAAETLKADPVDPDANLAVGRYECLFKGDWGRGLAMLALGSDAKLKELAAKELRGVSGVDDRMALGDGWWNLASAAEGAAKRQLEQRAAAWYEKALPELTGLLREKVEKRLDAIGPVPAASAEVKVDRLGPPTPVQLETISSKDTDAYPWVSPDGLTIYWTREGGSEESAIWSATRRDAGARFANPVRVLSGRQATFTADGLNAVLLVDNKLHSASRSSVARPFSKPQLIAEFARQPRPKSPALLDDGLTLVFQRAGRGGRGWEFVVSTRPTIEGPWSAPERVEITIPNNKNPALTWPFMTPDRKAMLFCLGADKVPYLMAAKRQATNAPFTHVVPVEVRGTPLRGRCPRYVEATHELYYCTLPSPESDDWDLWVVKNYLPPW